MNQSPLLRGYIDTNLLHDFGSRATFNSFDILGIDCAIKTSIALHHGLISAVKPIPQHKNAACSKANFTEEFARFEKINLNKDRHLKEMIKILPLHKWLNPELNSFFSKYCRFDPQNDTLVVGLFEKDARDRSLGKYCVDFHGLLITYKSAVHLTNPEYIITPNNLMTVYSKE